MQFEINDHEAKTMRKRPDKKVEFQSKDDCLNEQEMQLKSIYISAIN